MKSKTYPILAAGLLVIALSSLGYALWLHQQAQDEQFWLFVPNIETSAPKPQNIVGTWEGLSSRGFTYCLIHFAEDNTGWFIEYITGDTATPKQEALIWAVENDRIKIWGTSEHSPIVGECLIDGPMDGRPDKIMYFTRYEDCVGWRYILLPNNELSEKRAAGIKIGEGIQNK